MQEPFIGGFSKQRQSPGQFRSLVGTTHTLMSGRMQVFVGHKIEYVRSSGQGTGARVEFGFSHCRRFIVSNINDATSYFVA